jgi:hypothetical protein
VRQPGRQRGAAFLLALLLLALAALALTATDGLLRAAAGESERQTTEALARAREALIGRAVADDNRPGTLPCPAPDEKGQVPLFAGSHCPSYVGRFPWRTMRTGELRDGRGELLWFALAPVLRDNAAVEPVDGQAGTLLTVDGRSGIAAIVFSPGPPLAGQSRHADSSAGDYLDATNADGDTHFSATANDINDRLLPLAHATLFRTVGRRVLAEIGGPPGPNAVPPVAGLRRYHAVHDTFPWADGDDDGYADAGLAVGRVPYRELALPAVDTQAEDDAASGQAAQLTPDWLERNGWFARVRYRRQTADEARLELDGFDGPGSPDSPGNPESAGNPAGIALDLRPCPPVPCS